MPPGLPKNVKDNLEKCRESAIAAVDVYNRPAMRFRTATYLVLIIIAWTALMHSLFFKQGQRPWHRKKSSGSGRGVRYQKIDGEPRYWELAHCLKQYYGTNSPPERRNLEFLLGLRNKIEHRELPELDASLYGECQAALLNLEDLIAKEFGQKYSLTEQLAVSLQMSRVVPQEKKKVAKVLASGAAKTVREYVETFRGGLPSTVLSSMKYSFNVFLVPRVANRMKAADAAVEFIHVDEASKEELSRLEKLNVLIKEKHIPIANLDLYRPGQVLEELRAVVPFKVNMSTHTAAWKYFEVRPSSSTGKKRSTIAKYCVYDEAHNDFLYTEAWIKKLVKTFSNAREFEKIAGSKPVLK